MTMPSGWYDDPQTPDRLRYWDGITWSDHTTPKRSTPVPTTPVTVPGPPTPRAHDYSQAPTASSYAPAPALPMGSGPTTAEGAPLALWWQRLLARIVDNLITSLITGIVGAKWWLEYVRWFWGYLKDVVAAAERGVTTPPDQALMTEQAMKLLVPVLILGIVISFAYEAFFLTRSGATPGKKLFKITVRRSTRPGPLTVVEVLRRQAIPVGGNLLGFVPFLGLFATLWMALDNAWLLWDPRRQCLHDKLADTVVAQQAPHLTHQR